MNQTKSKESREGMIKIKQIRSSIGIPAKLRKVVKGLGFKKTNQVLLRMDTPEIRGMINKISHLVVILEEGKEEQ